MSSTYTFVRHLLPVSWRRSLRRVFGWRWMRGDYANWTDAKAAAQRVPRRESVARVVEAARAVRSGKAVWERDGVLFSSPTIHAPLLETLCTIGRDHGGVLDVIDFGGALGSTWWQHRAALAEFKVRWRIVEVPALVDAGKAEFTDDVVSFHFSIADACRMGNPSTILFSSVLQYLEDPAEVLADVRQRGFQRVILDRVGLVAGHRTRLVVQHTPPNLGGGACPCWLFDREELIRPLESDYALVAEWPVPFDEVDGVAEYRGLAFRQCVSR